MVEIGIMLGPASLVIFLVSFFSGDRVVRRALLVASGLLFLVFAVFVVVLEFGPDGRPKKEGLQASYRAALRNATNSIPCAAEFARLFPNAKCGLSYYIGGAGPPSLSMDADLYGRYELFMGPVLVTFDATRREVTSSGKPEFVLREITGLRKIRKAGSLGAVTNWSVSYNPDGQRRFGAGEWQKVVAAQGDFSVIGYRLITNNPVPGLREYRDGRPRE